MRGTSLRVLFLPTNATAFAIVGKTIFAVVENKSCSLRASIGAVRWFRFFAVSPSRLFSVRKVRFFFWKKGNRRKQSLDLTFSRPLYGFSFGMMPDGPILGCVLNMLNQEIENVDFGCLNDRSYLCAINYRRYMIWPE